MTDFPEFGHESSVTVTLRVSIAALGRQREILRFGAVKTGGLVSRVQPEGSCTSGTGIYRLTSEFRSLGGVVHRVGVEPRGRPKKRSAFP